MLLSRTGKAHMAFALIALMAGIGLAIVESTFMESIEIAAIRPDIAVLAVVIASCRTKFSKALVLAFSLGIMRDLFSGGNAGISAFGLTFMAYLLVSVEKYLLSDNWNAQILMVFAGSVVFGILLVLLKLVLGDEIGSFVKTPIVIIWTSVYTAVFAPAAFALMKKPQSPPYLRLKMKYDVERGTLPQTKV